MKNKNLVTLDKIHALCKRRGFVFQSASIYGGLNGVYDFGPLGTLMKQNIRESWKKSIKNSFESILFFEGSILGSKDTWQASGHVGNFSDPMVDCLNCKHRFRADEIDLKKACANCGKLNWSEVRQFNLMFKTNLGALEDESSIAYLRPETAQSIFINFKNIISTNRVKIPFGIAQIGKAFRNEITPKQFLFRTREFEQMEIEWFCKEENATNDFDLWCKARKKFYETIGLSLSKVRFRQHKETELAHYSKCCIDVEYEFPFGWKEIEGIAYRGDFDLKQHSKFSGKDLSIYDDNTKQSYIPHVIECSVGVDRLFLTLLFDAYHEDIVENEERIVLKLNPQIAPIKAGFFPLVKKLNDKMHKIFIDIKSKGYDIEYDESGSIGKRYRRQDEIGTPLCFTYDFESEKDHQVTVRNRDTTEQTRISIDFIEKYLEDFIKTNKTNL